MSKDEKKKVKPIYVGYLGPTNGYSFFSTTTLTQRTIIANTWELMTTREDVDHFEAQEGEQFVISKKLPDMTPQEYLQDKAKKKEA
ncbi:hypothetical protein KAR91_44495 [Candidatus Pacearchaeota archaeon]|nr:hypothetical protein [Candidatus Pacearchaeota archaeon]